MMTLELGDVGLPLPGRELDAAMAKFLGLNVVAMDWPCGYTYDCCSYQAAQWVPPIFDWQEKGPVYVPEHGIWPPETTQDYQEAHCVVEPVDFYSTTHALFQVMEAKKGKWLFCFTEGLTCLTTLLYEPHEGGVQQLSRMFIYWADYPDREHAYAHAICACTWKAMGGENA